MYILGGVGVGAVKVDFESNKLAQNPQISSWHCWVPLQDCDHANQGPKRIQETAPKAYWE